MPTKSARLQHIYYPPENDNLGQNKIPNSRYFQVHFEYLESQMADNRRCIEALQSQIVDLSLQISALANVMSESNNSK